MNLPILDAIDAALRAYEQPPAAFVLAPEPVVARCRCSWCRRAGMTAMLPAAGSDTATSPADWLRPRRRRRAETPQPRPAP